MRKKGIVKIKKEDNIEKEFQINELTVKQIIELTNNSSFFSGVLKDKEQKEEENIFEGLIENVDSIMTMCCNFSRQDLVDFDLAPSEVKELYEKFKEVNKDFFEVLKVTGIAEAFKEIRDVALTNFSRMLATSLNQDI